MLRADLGCLSRIQIKICCPTFFCSHKYHKIKKPIPDPGFGSTTLSIRYRTSYDGIIRMIGSKHNVNPDSGFFELMTGKGRPIMFLNVNLRSVILCTVPTIFSIPILKLQKYCSSYTVPVCTFSKPFAASFLSDPVQVSHPDPKKSGNFVLQTLKKILLNLEHYLRLND